ncbi:UbiA family prenyltransferase [Lentzea sp. NPDC051213]|uniref:UbiA family prenyltransferase n=1 Tax=Lentzea sp. NPDC051213 TaxID=3364126 RepID=UPI0037966794
MSPLISIHRLEHPLGMHYACCAAWGASYGTKFDLAVVLVVLANFVMIVAANVLNAYADVRNDLATAGKRRVATAVLEVGDHRVLQLAIIEMIVALALAAAVSWRAVAGIGLMILLYLAYNLEPVRLKRRGYAGPVVMGVAAWLLPSVTAYAAAGGRANPAVWLVFTGVTALAVGRGLWWAVPDREGDAAAGSITPTVRDGVRHAVDAATQFTVAGLLLVGGGLWLRFGLDWAIVGVTAIGAFLLVRRLPTTRQMLRYGFPIAVGGTVVLAAIPLLAQR